MRLPGGAAIAVLRPWWEAIPQRTRTAGAHSLYEPNGMERLPYVGNAGWHETAGMLRACARLWWAWASGWPDVGAVR